MAFFISSRWWENSRVRQHAAKHVGTPKAGAKPFLSTIGRKEPILLPRRTTFYLGRRHKTNNPNRRLQQETSRVRQHATNRVGTPKVGAKPFLSTIRRKEPILLPRRTTFYLGRKHKTNNPIEGCSKKHHGFDNMRLSMLGRRRRGRSPSFRQ